jgi:hypothetical protein
MSEIKINKKMFQISGGKSFDKFIKEVEATRNDSNDDGDYELSETAVKFIARSLARKVDWNKLKR